MLITAVTIILRVISQRNNMIELWSSQQSVVHFETLSLTNYNHFNVRVPNNKILLQFLSKVFIVIIRLFKKVKQENCNMFLIPMQLELTRKTRYSRGR